MRIRGIVRTATLEENPPGSDQIEMVLRVQGVGPGQPRTLVVPYELLLADPDLDADAIQGKGFEAEAEEAEARALGRRRDRARDGPGPPQAPVILVETTRGRNLGLPPAWHGHLARGRSSRPGRPCHIGAILKPTGQLPAIIRR